MFGEIIQPINQLSERVHRLNGLIFNLETVVLALTDAIVQHTRAINEQNVLTRKASHESDRL